MAWVFLGQSLWSVKQDTCEYPSALVGILDCYQG